MIQDICTGMFPVSKTLKFELRPVGRTLEYIKAKGLLEEDEHRADSYQCVKEMMDDYHKSYISTQLESLVLPVASTGSMDSIEEFMSYYNSLPGGHGTSPELETVKSNLKRTVSRHLQNNPMFQRMFRKELLKEDLKNGLEDASKLQSIEEFSSYTSYFTGYHMIRRNMYAEDGKANSVGYRLIDENLVIFVRNIRRFKESVGDALGDEILDKLFTQCSQHLTVENIWQMFEPAYFNNTLSQRGIDVYNAVLDGYIQNNGTTVTGLNVLISNYNQRQGSRGAKLPKLDKLRKQILSDKLPLSWVPEKFNTDGQVIEAVRDFCGRLFHTVLNDRREDGGRSLYNLVSCLDEFDEKKIYLSKDRSLGDVSFALSGNAVYLRHLILEDAKNTCLRKKRETEAVWLERVAKSVESVKHFSIGYLNGLMEDVTTENQKTIQEAYFNNLSVFMVAEQRYEAARELLHTPYPQNIKLSQDTGAVELLKDLLDAIKNIQWFVKPLAAGCRIADADAVFYGEFTPMWTELCAVNELYDKVRNYISRKPYSTDKIRLNFRNTFLLSGWSTGIRSDACSIILRKDGAYFLAIADKKHNHVLDEGCVKAGVDNYEMMDYRLLPGASKMLPKLFFSEKGMRLYNPSEEVLEAYRNDRHVKSKGRFDLASMRLVIDYFKQSLAASESYGTWNWQFTPTDEYADISGFYREVDRQGYKLKFMDVDSGYVDGLVDEGKLYLFRIWNEDCSKFSNGNKKLNTLYWEALFDHRNLERPDIIYKLNGEGRIFFRKASIRNKRPTHPAGIPVANKNARNSKKESVFGYDLIKDKRYTIDKFHFHIPITMNWAVRQTDSVNRAVNGYIREHNDFHLISIVRGECSLLYVSVIDTHGRIKEQRSLDILGDTGVGTDYGTLIRQRQEERTDAQKKWGNIRDIKDLKAGYVSQVVHVVLELMERYNALVVLENPDFLSTVGNPVLDKADMSHLVTRLIEKLNFVVKKRREADALYGVFRAVQMTEKLDSFERMGNQSGVVFLVSGVVTPMVDPTTGFCNMASFKCSELGQARELIALLDDIRYNHREGYFEIDIDFAKYTAKLEGSRTRWTVCTYGNRISVYRRYNVLHNETVGLTERMASLLAGMKVDIHRNIREQVLRIIDDKVTGAKDFALALVGLLRLAMQVRNMDSVTGENYVTSPVRTPDGFFRSSPEQTDKPVDVDANKAYNVATRGLMVVRAIRESENGRPRLSSGYPQWLKAIQDGSLFE